MKCTTVYIGLDVHKESFAPVGYNNKKDEAEYLQRTETQYVNCKA